MDSTFSKVTDLQPETLLKLHSAKEISLETCKTSEKG